MQHTTFTHLRQNAKSFFDAVENGDTVRVFRNGHPIADIVPLRPDTPAWKTSSTPLTINGLSLSDEIRHDRDTAV